MVLYAFTQSMSCIRTFCMLALWCMSTQRVCVCLHPWNTKGWMPFLCFVLLLVCINHVFFTTFYFGAFFPPQTNIFLLAQLFPSTFWQNFQNIYVFFFPKTRKFEFRSFRRRKKNQNTSPQTFTMLFSLPLCIQTMLGGSPIFVFHTFLRFFHIFRRFLERHVLGFGVSWRFFAFLIYFHWFLR